MLLLHDVSFSLLAMQHWTHRIAPVDALTRVDTLTVVYIVQPPVVIVAIPVLLPIERLGSP